MIVSITHEHDLDGLGSQAILKRYLDYYYKEEKHELNQYFANYFDFIQKVRSVSNSKFIPSKLIITDIGFNDEFKVIFPLLNNLKNEGCRILWFDHHLVSKEIKDKIKNLTSIYINDPLRCTAEIVKDYFLPNDPIAKKVAKLARDSDFKTNKFKFAEDLQLIIGYNRGESRYHEKIKLISLLSKGAFQDPWFGAQLEKLKEWFNEESQFAITHINNVNIEGFGDIIISFAGISGGKITDLLKKVFPDGRIYIGIDTRFNEIIITSEYVNCRDFAVKFNGGGHKSRAGFKYKQIFLERGIVNPQFIQDIKFELLKFQNK